MNITITTKQISLSDEMKDRVAFKLERLSHFLKDAGKESRLELDISKAAGRHHLKGNVFAIQAKLHSAPLLIAAKAVGESVLDACDKVKEELERQLLKQKAKHQANERKTRQAVRALRGKE